MFKSLLWYMNADVSRITQNMFKKNHFLWNEIKKQRPGKIEGQLSKACWRRRNFVNEEFTGT